MHASTREERRPSSDTIQPDPRARPIAPGSPLRPQGDEPHEPKPDAPNPAA